MINLMLNDLCRPTGEGFCARLHFHSLILHLDGLIALAFAWTAEKRKASFLGVIRNLLLDDLGIEHHGICRSSSTFIEKGDDALSHTDYICRYADITFSMRLSISSKFFAPANILGLCQYKIRREKCDCVYNL